MKEGIRSRVCRMPLISPISVATPTAARIPRMPMLKFGPSFSAPVSGLMLATSRLAMTELNAMIPSTDRSIPPIMITRETPNAAISRIALCLARPARFVGLKKRGVMRVITMHSPIRMSSGPTTAGMRRSLPSTPCQASSLMSLMPLGFTPVRTIGLPHGARCTAPGAASATPGACGGRSRPFKDSTFSETSGLLLDPAPQVVPIVLRDAVDVVRPVPPWRCPGRRRPASK